MYTAPVVRRRKKKLYIENRQIVEKKKLTWENIVYSFPVGKNNRVVLFLLLHKLRLTRRRAAVHVYTIYYNERLTVRCLHVFIYTYIPCTRGTYFIIVIGLFIYYHFFFFFSFFLSLTLCVLTNSSMLTLCTRACTFGVRNARGETRSR